MSRVNFGAKPVMYPMPVSMQPRVPLSMPR